VLPVRQVLLELQETPAPLVLRVPLDRLGRKVLRDLLAHVEGLTAGRSFRAAAFSSCQPELAD